MATSRSVQFRNVNAVVTAYVNREVPAWSIWQGGQFMFKYEGNDIGEGTAMLEETLKVLQQSAAIYTLKVYEDLGKGKIKNNTPDDGSFNFRFVEDPYNVPGNANNELLTELRALKLQVEELQNAEPEPEDNPLGIVGHVLAMPGVSEAVATMVPALIGKIFGTNNSPAALAGIPENTGIHNEAEALQVLRAKDPLFEQHIIKLACIARDRPETFVQIVGMLKHMP